MVSGLRKRVEAPKLLTRGTKTISSKSISLKRIPQRTCVACRTVKAKRDLIRLVCTPGGNVEIDSEGRKTGRGAYLCRELACWESGLKGNRLDHALRGSLSRENREQLITWVKDLLKGVN